GVSDKAKEESLRSAASSLRNNIEMAIAEGEAGGIEEANDGNWLTFGDSSVSMNQPDNIIIDSIDDPIDDDNNEYELVLEHEDLGEDDYITITENGISDIGEDASDTDDSQ
ncbi:MAG: hypothetical protein ACOC4G_11315, partial [Bacillota bacterium]